MDSKTPKDVKAEGKALTELLVVGGSRHAGSGEFNQATRCVSMFFERRLEGVRTSSFRRVVVSCREVLPRSRISNYGGIMELQVLFDFDRWVSGDEREKKRGIADAIVDAVVATEAETLLPSGRFKSIRDEFVEVDFDTNWYHGTPKWNRKRDLCARIRMEHGLQSCSIVVEIAAQGQEVPQRHSIASAGPRDWAFVPFMGRIKWIGSRSLEYSAKALPAPIRIDA